MINSHSSLPFFLQIYRKSTFFQEMEKEKTKNNLYLISQYLPKNYQIMERKRSKGFRRIFTEAFDRLFQVNVNDCPAGAINMRKATVKIRRNPLLCFLSLSHTRWKIEKILTYKDHKQSGTCLPSILVDMYMLQTWGHRKLHSYTGTCSHSLVPRCLLDMLKIKSHKKL